MIAKNSIFISYRRSDSRIWTERVYEHLERHFGAGAVFKDIGSIPTGEDFRIYLNQTVGRCQVLVVVIGPTWLDVLIQRLAEPKDWVRAEIEVALSRNIPVIPLLVDGARPPAENALPEGMKALASRNAEDILPDPRFQDDVGRLIRRLEDIVGKVSSGESALASESGEWKVPDELSGDDYTLLVEALMAAFPEKESLSLMVSRGLRQKLNLITQGASSYETTVDRLVGWAEAQGQLQALMEGAIKRNPGNPKLKNLAQSWSL